MTKQEEKHINTTGPRNSLEFMLLIQLWKYSLTKYKISRSCSSPKILPDLNINCVEFAEICDLLLGRILMHRRS